jgi:outer membrane protein
MSGIWRPYQFRQEPPINLGNSGRLDALVRAGQLYLSLQDAVALALENNLDIEIQRYGPRLADSDILRAQAGGLLRGVPTSVAAGASSAVAQATGSAGGSAAGGGGGGGGTGTGASTSQAGGAVITATGSTIPNYDPVVNFAYNWGHRSVPQSNAFTTGTNTLVLTSSTPNMSIQKGFVTGTTVTFGWNNTFSTTNAARTDFNPSTTANFSLQFNQHLLQGFGRAVNNRNIRIAQNNRSVSDQVFRQQVITTISAIINLYWDLVSFNEDVRVKRQAVALAQKLYEDNQKQVEIGTLAPIEIVRAEAQMASSQQDLVVSETRVLLQETILKNALSRTGTASPSVADAHIVPMDTIRIPPAEAIEPLQDLIGSAMKNRPEIMQTQLQVENTKIGLQGTKSEMRPTLDLVGNLQNNGLAGQINVIPIPGTPVGTPRSVNDFFLGGYGTAMSQLFRRNFPDYGIGFQLNIPLKNRAAQADMVRDQVSLRQQEIRQQQQINQVRVDVTNAMIAVQQARANYEAAVKARVLQEQTLDAEQKKYALGASTNFLVIQSQRDLAAAQSAEVNARGVYSRARVLLDQATGRTLEANSIQLDEAETGHVSRGPSPLPPESRQ